MARVVHANNANGKAVTPFWAALAHPEHGKTKCAWLTDWFCVLILAACGGLCQGPLHSWFQRDFTEVPLYLNAAHLSAPLLDEEISSAGIVALCCVPAWVILAIFTLTPSLSSKRSWTERLAEWHVAMMGHLLALGMELFFQGPLSIYVGEWRPYLLDQCKPDATVAAAHNAACTAKGLEWCAQTFSATACTNHDGEFFENGWMGRSFVSGHSGFSTASCMYLVWFFLGKTRAMGSGRERALWKILVVLTLLCGTLMVGLSRLVDKRHHWWNILHGFLLGFIVGTFAYFYYWPSIYAGLSHSPRSMLEKEGDLEKMSDEEGGSMLYYLQTNGSSRGADGSSVALPVSVDDDGAKSGGVAVDVSSTAENCK